MKNHKTKLKSEKGRDDDVTLDFSCQMRIKFALKTQGEMQGKNNKWEFLVASLKVSDIFFPREKREMTITVNHFSFCYLTRAKRKNIEGNKKTKLEKFNCCNKGNECIFPQLA